MYKENDATLYQGKGVCTWSYRSWRAFGYFESQKDVTNESALAMICKLEEREKRWIFAQWRCEIMVHIHYVHLKANKRLLNAYKSLTVKHTKRIQRYIYCSCKPYSLSSTSQRITLHYQMQSPGKAHWKLSEFLTLPLFFWCACI